MSGWRKKVRAHRRHKGWTRDPFYVYLELLNEMVDEVVIKVLTAKVGITSGGFDLENTLLNGQEGDIECTTTKIEDGNVAFTIRRTLRPEMVPVSLVA
jgi:hypothetical protein